MGEVIAFPLSDSRFKPYLDRQCGPVIQVVLQESVDSFPLVAQILSEDEGAVTRRLYRDHVNVAQQLATMDTIARDFRDAADLIQLARERLCMAAADLVGPASGEDLSGLCPFQRSSGAS